MCTVNLGIASYDHLAITPIRHSPPLSVQLPPPHSPSICRSLLVSISIYVILFEVNLRSLSWSPNLIFLSFSLITSLGTRLNSHMQGKEGIAEVDHRGEKGKKGELGWEDGASEGWEKNYLAPVCSAEAVSFDLLHDASSGLLCPLPSLFLFSSSHWYFLLFCTSFPLYRYLSSTFSSSPILLSSALRSASEAVQPNPLMWGQGFWKCDGSVPWAILPPEYLSILEYHSIL